MGHSWDLLEVLRLLIALCVVLIAPGYLLAHAVRVDGPWDVRAAYWIGMGFGCVTLIYLWAAALRLHLAPLFIQAMALIAGSAALIAALRGIRRHPSAIGHPPGVLGRDPHHPAAGVTHGAARRWDGLIGAFLLVLILVLTIGVRFVQVQTLALPAWVDSLHNALLIRVAFEQGQAPIDYAPYLPVSASPFHWGYQALTAAILTAAGLPVPGALPQAMIWVGQILNGLCALTCAALARRIWRHPLAGPTAALVVGLISIMPAYYTSWGRYTMTGGALLLPIVLLAFHDLLQQRQRSILPAAIVLAALFTTHQVLFVFALAGGAAFWLCEGWSRRRGTITGVRLLLTISMGMILALPWLLTLVRYAFGGDQAPGSRIIGSDAYNSMPWALFWAVNNRWLLALAAIGGMLALRHSHRYAAAIALWCSAVLLLTNPVVIGLPYSAQLHNEYIALLLFLPCALLIAGGISVLGSQFSVLSIRFFIPICILVLACWGAWQSRSVLRPDTILATADDLAAITWAAEQTPPDARFVVATAGWLGYVDRGADGGWWLLPLAGRAVSTPPVLYTYADPAFVAAVQADSGWLRTNQDAAPEDLAQFMRERGYPYIYVTRRGWGAAGEQFRASELFEELYAGGDVAILRLRQ